MQRGEMRVRRERRAALGLSAMLAPSRSAPIPNPCSLSPDPWPLTPGP